MEPCRSTLDVSEMIRQFAAGQTDALDWFVSGNYPRMNNMAARLVRRYRVGSTDYDAEDAVEDTLAGLCQAAKDGKIEWVQNVEDFWRLFYSSLRCKILLARDRCATRKL